jgi:hypothetical protein
MDQDGPGTLYGPIKRMLAEGLIEESDERPDPAMDDQRRRYYRITDFGRRVAGAEAERMSGLGRDGMRQEAARRSRDLLARGRLMPHSGRIYRLLLLAYPREFRRQFGGEMVQAFGDSCREARRRGGVTGLVMVWVRTVPNLAFTAIAERHRAVRNGWLFALIPLALALGFAIAYVDSSPGGMTRASPRQPCSASAVCSECSIRPGPGSGRSRWEPGFPFTA